MKKVEQAGRRHVWHRHGPWAALFGAAWLASFFIAFDTPVRLCLFLRWTNYPCMFCGFTRSFAALSQGAWSFAFRNAPLAVFLYAAMVAAFFWNVLPLLGQRTGPGTRLSKIMEQPMTWLGLGLLVLLNWAYRLSLGLQ